MKKMLKGMSSYVVVLFLFLVVCFSEISLAQSPESLFNNGNKAYTSGEFDQAQNFYEQAIALDAGKKYPQAVFNLGNTLFQQKKFDEAVKQYRNFITGSGSSSLSEQAWYNAGNSYLALKNYDEAIAAYKKSLLINPKDADARYNLTLAMQLSGGRSNQSSVNSLQQNQTNAPKSRPLTDEEKKELLKHLADLEKKTIQDVSRTEPSGKKKTQKDW